MADGESSIASQRASYSGHSIFVWLPIIPAGTGFLSSAGAHVVRESSKIVSLLASLAAINNKYLVKTGTPVLLVEALNFSWIPDQNHLYWDHNRKTEL